MRIVHACSVMSDSLAIPWTIACWTPPSMGFPRQEYWSGLPFPTPEDLPDPGIEPWFQAVSSVSPALAGRFFTTAPPGKPMKTETYSSIISDKPDFCKLKVFQIWSDNQNTFKKGFVPHSPHPQETKQAQHWWSSTKRN